MPRRLPIAIAAGALLASAPFIHAPLAAQTAEPPNRTSFSLGFAAGRYEYDAIGTGFANNVGLTLGWGRTPRWLDVESRLAVSRFQQQSGIVFFNPGGGFTAAPGRSLTLAHVEHQIALIAPWLGLRPFVGFLIGTSLITGERDGEFPVGTSGGVALGLRLQGATGPNLGAGVRVRAIDHISMVAGEFTFDVRVPIP